MGLSPAAAARHLGITWNCDTRAISRPRRVVSGIHTDVGMDDRGLRAIARS